jgi:pyruvate,water dikinase
MILPLNSLQVNLDNSGGKGANLSKLINAGFSVPDGFILTTEAYNSYIEANNLGDRIFERINAIHSLDASQIEEASKEIRSWFSPSKIPQTITNQVTEAYNLLGEPAVAVRSSATAEDLPELSFAGQQDTFLNIIGTEALLKAVTVCWSSLWTVRAISYRGRNNIPHSDISLAVIIQIMVPSESSGIMFTANPLTGSRLELVIDATLGLGEALVSGYAEPDHYLVDLEQRKIISKTIGSKKITTQSKSGGGVLTSESKSQGQQAIPDETILSLADQGVKINDLYQFPQDIEWGFAGGKIHLLQSRPITSLFPIPAGMDPSPVRVMISFASIQGIMEPLTPLGQDAIRLIFAGAGSLVGYQVTHETQGVFKIAGERLWADITAVIRHPIGSRAVLRFLSVVDQSVMEKLTVLKDDPGLDFGQGRLRFSTFKRLAQFFFPLWKRIFSYIKSPRGVADQIHQASQAEIARIKDEYSNSIEPSQKLNDSVILLHEIYNAFPFAVPQIASGTAAGLIPFFLLNKISTQLTGNNDLSLEITRGLPNNVTTEMDLSLWAAAKAIRSDQAAYQHLIDDNPENLAKDFLEKQLPESAQSEVAKFLATYGMRGLGEIDIGRKRWREDPTYIFEVISGYLQIEDEKLAPDVVFKMGEQAAKEAIQKLQQIAKSTFAGRVKAAIIGKLALRVRELAGLRESPKFHIIQLFGIIRLALLDSGEELVARGKIESAQDLFFLYLNELELLANDEDRDWKGLIAERREIYACELSRKQIPRLLLSDGRAFYEGMESIEGDDNKLVGNPVSPGTAQGRVRVVVDPTDANLSPGEIMVCPGTDPAWTPLFLTAGGLIMEVGGMMTHGAIVAREYGIPAVVGIHNATSTFQTGQEIQINGSTGDIYLLDSEPK